MFPGVVVRRIKGTGRAHFDLLLAYRLVHLAVMNPEAVLSQN